MDQNNTFFIVRCYRAALHTKKRITQYLIYEKNIKAY